MAREMSLCRFAVGSEAHLGLIADGELYDLSTLQVPAYRSLGAWLRDASGRVEQALDDLEKVPATVRPMGLAEAVLQGAPSRLLKPLDVQEVWACGVTYEMSREARMHESQEPTIYGKVYDAPRPEVFFKATPNRVVGPGEAVAIRRDSSWNVPEPELVVVATANMEAIGYTAGNDMSSRSIEGENPLYLPQAKVYRSSCALGPVIRLARAFDPLNLAIRCTIYRNEEVLFRGETSTARIHRSLSELLACVGHSNQYPEGIFVLTGTGIVPPDTVTLKEHDVVEIDIEGIGTLRNPVTWA